MAAQAAVSVAQGLVLLAAALLLLALVVQVVWADVAAHAIAAPSAEEAARAAWLVGLAPAASAA